MSSRPLRVSYVVCTAHLSLPIRVPARSLLAFAEGAHPHLLAPGGGRLVWCRSSLSENIFPAFTLLFLLAAAWCGAAQDQPRAASRHVRPPTRARSVNNGGAGISNAFEWQM